MKTLSISNFKGGVGKTTTAVNLAYVFAAQGKRVLLIDLDPQASATDYFGLYDAGVTENKTTIELLYNNAAIQDVALQSDTENIWVVPSAIELIDQNEALLHEQSLRFALDDAADDFDIAIIDCSPVMKRLAICAYLAASRDGMIVVPVKLDSSVMRETALVTRTASAICAALRLPQPAYKILRTCVPGRLTKGEVTGAAVLDRFFPDKQLSTHIHASCKVGEGSWVWQPVVSFAPTSRPARDYVALAKEVCDELKQ